MTPMDKKNVAAILDEIGTLLELQGENPFRCNAYHAAARAIDQMEHDLAQIVAEQKLDSIKGIGSTLQDKITVLVTTGDLPFYTELKAKIPAGMVDMLRLPSLGPKKIRALADQLAVTDLIVLKAACEAGTVAGLKGFAPRRNRRSWRDGFLEKVGQRAIDEAMAVAGPCRRAGAGREKIELLQPARRKRPSRTLTCLSHQGRRADRPVCQTTGLASGRRWWDLASAYGERVSAGHVLHEC